MLDYMDCIFTYLYGYPTISRAWRMVKIPGIAPAHIMYRPQARSRLPGLGSFVTRAPPMQNSQEKTFSRLLMGGTHVYPTLLLFLSGTVGHPYWDPRSPHARLQPPL